MLRRNADAEDQNIISFKKFQDILKEEGITFNESENEILMQAFVVNQDRNNIKLAIGQLYSIKTTKKIRKIYDKVNMYEEMDNPDLVDNSGYFGIFYREKINLS